MNMKQLVICLGVAVIINLALTIFFITKVFRLEKRAKKPLQHHKSHSTSNGSKGIFIGIFLLIFVILIILAEAPAVFMAVYKIPGDAPFSDGRYAFWGSLLGGAIGGIAALLTIYYTIRYYNKKDAEQKNLEVYRQQVTKIDKIISAINNRDVINYDFTYALGFSKELLQVIINYNGLVCWLKGLFAEYGMGVLGAFQQEYSDLQKVKKPYYKIQEILNDKIHFIRGCFSRDSQLEEENEWRIKRPSVIEFLNLQPELRQCAERIGHLGLYENANELIHSDPTLSYILEIEGGGSAGLWASLIHDPQGAFSGDPDQYNRWKEFNTCVQNLLIHLSEFKITEYQRIVVEGEAVTLPQYYIKKEGSFMHETTTVEEYPPKEEVASKP